MDHDALVEQLLAWCKGVMENIWQAADLHRVATASLAIVEQMRQVAREMLQAKVHREAEPLKRAAVTPCGQAAGASDVYTRTVSPQTVLGEVHIPVRTFPCDGCGASRRPDDRHLGVPEGGDCTDDGRARDAPVVAERPHRVANDLVARCTGVALSSRGAQGLIDSTAQDLQPWQAERGMPAAAAVVEALAAGDGAADLRVEIARDGVMAPSDGRGQAVQVATHLVRWLDAQAEEPTLGTVIARRSVCVLGAAADLAARIQQVIGEAGWAPISSGEILGDGAPWMWHAADPHVPGVRQTLDSSHLSAPL